MNLSHIRLLVSDFDGCFRFYRDVMGFRPTWGDEGDSYASFETGAGRGLALFARGEMARVLGTEEIPAESAGRDRVALIVEADDLDGTVVTLQERGARFLLEPRDYPGWGIRAAYLRDPDGTLIELNQELPKQEWTEGLREALETNEHAARR